MRKTAGISCVALVCGVVLGNACNSSNPPNPPPTPPSLLDEYEPVGVPDPGGITEITFNPDGTYSLRRTADSTADEIISHEDGTFTLDLNASTLTLTPTGGSPQTHSFQLELSGTSNSAASGDLHTMGLIGTLTQIIISFFMDGTQYHTDSPAIPTSGTTDDAGWSEDAGPADDAGIEGGGCSGEPIAPPTGHGNGVDVSDYQKNPTWSSVPRNFAFAKATEGTAFTGKTFASNYTGIQAAGLQRGAYHFFRYSQDPVAQADHFVAVLQANGFDERTDLAPMVDVEQTAEVKGMAAATVVSNVRAFLNEAQSKLGVTLFIYTAPYFWRDTLGNPNFSSNPLWIAHYTQASHPMVPSSWSNYTIWQFTDHDNVPGITGGVDGDRWNGALAPVDGGTTDGGSSYGVCGPVDASGDAPPPPPDGGDASVIPGTCTHDVCTPGTALGQACTSCTMLVCQNDPYCCDTYWGLSCFPDVQKYCGMTCP